MRAEVRRGCADRNPSRPPRRIAASLRHCAPRYGVSASPWSCAPPRRRSDLALGTTAFALAPRSGAAPSVSGTTTFALELVPFALELVPLRGRFGRAPALCPALGVRDAKNRRFWSLAVKTDGFSRSRKWEMDVFVGCARMGFPIAQIIACFGLEAAKNRLF